MLGVRVRIIYYPLQVRVPSGAINYYFWNSFANSRTIRYPFDSFHIGIITAFLTYYILFIQKVLFYINCLVFLISCMSLSFSN